MAATFSDLWILKPKVFIGDLGPNANEDELKELFAEYGPVQDLWLAKEGNGFALVEFQVDKDGLRATHGLKKTISEVKSTTSTIRGCLYKEVLF
ncbi:hypothetical protein TCAL_09150 [Tigriopus californicus]|uniref:RRM domain-containing protein n=1 Tax=Tigriopus californicus TaxID=6832 RepID=A0A553N915_TIGCA|nr:hypothetical protein TCAL_09150 [Tigriopus californicus]|eukprot:TCALIF_09150-PA protein Name:"Similar to Rbp1 RNA-binding protein 1 (Drosophila melanogaster)" AED:0.06 eAED:0.08 QI:0/-1/0/1/-1/1/1/0/93